MPEISNQVRAGESVHAVILADGLGMRLRPYTTVRPEPLIHVGEHHILEKSIPPLTAGACAGWTSAWAVHAIVDRVVDDYARHAGIEKDIDGIEAEVFSGSPDVSRRSRGDCAPACDHGLADIQRRLMASPRWTRRRPAICATSRTPRCASKGMPTRSTSLLRNILNVNLTLETNSLSEGGNRQNEEVKKISALAAIIVCAHDRGHDLRHELRAHARAGLPSGLPDAKTTNRKLIAWVEEIAELLSCPLGPQRRGPHVHLLGARGGPGPDEQLA